MEAVMAKYIEVIFDGPPGHNMPRFIEVEDENGFRTTVGEWFSCGIDGRWGLRISAKDIEQWHPEATHARVEAGRPAKPQPK
jgi:hypothetical protein